MDAKETLALLYVAKRLFPRDRSLEVEPKELVEISKAWAEVLEDIPFYVAKAALKAQSSTSSFPPTIKEIRDYATRMNGKRRMTAEEAWGIASDMMRTYSARLVPIEGFVREEEPVAKFGEPVKIRKSGLEYEAKRHCPPDVWELMEHMGYADMCASENPDVIRGQFMRSWDSHNKEEYEKRVIGGILPEFLKDMNLLNGGVNGELPE
jgi:hypothetical protein